MTLTAKTDSFDRTTAGKAQTLRGQGNVDGGYNPGSTGVLNVAVVEYDFSKDGALAVGTNGSGVFIPANSVIHNVVMDVLTVPVGPTNMGVTLETDNDLFASAAISGAPWSTTGRKLGVPDFATVADAVKTTAVREVCVSATAAASTAGKFVIYIFYTPGNVA